MAEFLKVGNIVSPNGASVIFGAESSEDGTSLKTTNSDTYLPYDIVIVEENTDETLPAEQIIYDPPSDSAITSTTVQGAISELENIIYATTPIFSQEVVTLTANAGSCTLSKTFSSTAMMVFYNGLLINEGIHFSLSGKIISFLDFAAEEGDILTVIGLASAGGGN